MKTIKTNTQGSTTMLQSREAYEAMQSYQRDNKKLLQSVKKITRHLELNHLKNSEFLQALGEFINGSKND